MTKDEALTMIIASIAMEELALSHIVNAEGEKLQYVLGTLSKKPDLCANMREILAVNKSVKSLLDTVAQNQMLLKGKLETALEACGHTPVPEPPDSGDPCGPCKPCGACGTCEPCGLYKPCGLWRPGKPPCTGGAPCQPKSAIQLVSRGNGFSWCGGFLMSWKCQSQEGRSIHWDENAPAQIELDPGKAYALNLVIHLCGAFPGGGTGEIRVKRTPRNAFLDIPPLRFYVKYLECGPMTLQYSATLFPHECPPPTASLSLLLNYKDSLFVDRASLCITEL